MPPIEPVKKKSPVPISGAKYANTPSGALQKTMHRNANLALGFVDLNPKYTEYRHERAKDLAGRWLKILSASLKQKIYDKKRENFNKKMQVTSNLHRMNYDQIKMLSSTYRKDVIDITRQKDK